MCCVVLCCVVLCVSCAHQCFPYVSLRLPSVYFVFTFVCLLMQISIIVDVLPSRQFEIPQGIDLICGLSFILCIWRLFPFSLHKLLTPCSELPVTALKQCNDCSGKFSVSFSPDRSPTCKLRILRHRMDMRLKEKDENHIISKNKVAEFSLKGKFINKNFSFKNKDTHVILPLYVSRVRPHLKYAVQFWSPHHTWDVTELEVVQGRTTKIITPLCNKSY